MSETHQKVIQYAADITDYKAKLDQIEAQNRQMAISLKNDLESIGTSLGEATKTFKGSQVFDNKGMKTAMTSTEQYAEKVKTLDGRMGTLTTTTATLADGTQKVSTSFREADINTKSFMENMSQLAKRAVMTIPIWLLLRGAVVQISKTFSDGIKGLIDYDLALQKVRRNLSGTPEELDAQFKTMSRVITDFSLKTGISTEVLAEAMKKFATLGFSFEESLAGAMSSAKLSTVLFGDAGETADAFARALKLLIDRSKGAKSATEQMNESFALVAELEKTNQFEINEVTASLKNFGGTAKTLGLSMNETLAILATLGTGMMEGARGGTAASSAFQVLVKNLKEVAKTLGINVNPNTQRMSDIFVEVISVIQKLGKTDIQGQTDAINKLFGGLRGAKPIRALVGDLDNLKRNLQIKPNVDDFEAQFNRLLETTSGQAKIIANYRREVDKAFISGIAGADDFRGALISIKGTMEDLLPLMRDIGLAIRTGIIGLGTLGLGLVLDPLFKEVKRVADTASNLNVKVVSGLKGGLNTKDLQQMIADLGKVDIKQLNAIGISQNTLNALGKQLQNQIKTGFNKNPVKAEVATEVDPKLELNRQKLAEVILKSSIEQLKAQGASTAEAVKAEIIYSKILGIQLEKDKQLEKELELERALSAEKKLQSRLGSDSMKLFKVAQEQGVNIAKQIGDVLAGNIDFSSFIRRGGEAVDTFKKQFSDLFEQQQALAFFQGNRIPGMNNLRGGAGIAINEEAIRQPLNRSGLLRTMIKNNAMPNPQTVGAIANTFNQTNNITQNFNIDKVADQDEFNKMAKTAFDDPAIQKKLAQIQSGDRQNQVL